jgi:hypothetical protein
LGKTIALRFENDRFFKKPALYALKTLNFKLTLPSLAHGPWPWTEPQMNLRLLRSNSLKFQPLIPKVCRERLLALF